MYQGHRDLNVGTPPPTPREEIPRRQNFTQFVVWKEPFEAFHWSVERAACLWRAYFPKLRVVYANGVMYAKYKHKSLQNTIVAPFFRRATLSTSMRITNYEQAMLMTILQSCRPLVWHDVDGWGARTRGSSWTCRIMLVLGTFQNKQRRVFND